MRLRPELCPPLVTPERAAQLPWHGESTEATITAFTGHTYTCVDFHSWARARTVEEFAVEAARSSWPRFPDVT